MNADSRRSLGYGLLLGAAGVTLLMLAWLATSGAEAGGVVLGLLLLFVIAGPLAAAGAYVVARARTERVEEQVFSTKRRVHDADRLFRAELATQLRQLAQQPRMPRDHLERIADDIASQLTDESAWYATVHLTDAQVALLGQYDDLVWERVRWLRAHADENTATLSTAIDQLQQALDQRTDLLIRGREAPSVAPATLLQTRPAVPVGIEQLGVGAAVTRDGADFVVDGLTSSFADGQTWMLVHLVPSGPDATEHWLSIPPDGRDLAWLDSLPPVDPGAQQLVIDGSVLPLADARSALVQVATSRGSAPGVLVRSWSYGSGPLVGLVEQWPEGTVRTYGGKIVNARELEIWPAPDEHNVALPVRNPARNG